MEKLTYKKVANISLEIDLHNGYSVIVSGLYDTAKQNYKISYQLKDNNMDTFELILENIEIVANPKTIGSAILKYTSTLLSDGTIKKEIEKYEYMMKCFDKGNTLLEEEKDIAISKPIKGRIAHMTVYYCSICGDYVDPEHKYCPHCRAKLDWIF